MAFQHALPRLSSATVEALPLISKRTANSKVVLGWCKPGKSQKELRTTHSALNTARPLIQPPPTDLHTQEYKSSFSNYTPRWSFQDLNVSETQLSSYSDTRVKYPRSSPKTLACSVDIHSKQLFFGRSSKISCQQQSFSTIVSRHHRVLSVVRQQSRTLFGNASTNTLSFLEDSANKHPEDANRQYIFYQALSRANMSAIIIERYQSKKFASNSACETIYHQALGAISSGNVTGSQINPIGSSTNGFNDAQIQAVGQAIAAKSQGANLSISRGGFGASRGIKESPLYVVVEESIGVQIFKWFKFVAIFGFVVYLSLAIVTLVIDSLQSFKKVGGKLDNEAKAEQQNVRFSDVHGCDEAKEELQELVEFLKNPERFSSLGGKLPKGVLLVGPPGTGKTLLARAVAGEAGVPFFFMSGSEFDEIYVGVGAKRVRELFNTAKSKSPAIVFIDELDAIGGKRSARDTTYAKQTLNQLLTELDGFDQTSGVIILGATNFPESLDKALTRPGRFDRNVVVDLPDVRGRMAILKHHMKKVIVSNDVSIETLAAGTPGFSGAELENIINQAAVRASKAKSSEVSMLDFEWAKDKLLMGAEKRSMVIPQKEKELTAYHEAGHALVLMFTRGADPLHKVTIMPRGQALGVTFHLPEIDKYSKTVEEYRATIDVCMGGKVAEELIFGAENVTSGCSSDLTQATKAAYAMVASFGMSKKLGHVDLASNYENLSAGTKQLVESEVRRTLEDGYNRAKELISSRENELHLLARALLNYEMLNRDEAFKVIRGEKLEGKIPVSSDVIKIPDIGVGLSADLPSLPGSVMQPPAGKEPPADDTLP
ncbi:Mitochondrial inner membrane i-AAA protease supercomplex subunit [Podosphaera aphanis]|nr:Mitochondrial inner membrane i-AAA protease supercomplex subunit [Podosphaera aphanis]